MSHATAAPELPSLIACSHGTRSPAGRRAMARLRLDLAALRPGLEILAASVDVQKPALPDVVRKVTSGRRRCVVVPLLLTAGYHVRTDVTRAVASGGGLAVAAGALGPAPAIVDVLCDRIAETGAGPDDSLVLAAAGSSDPEAVADVERIAAELALRIGRPIRSGYLSAASPTVAEAVAAVRAARPGQPVTVVTFLLAPGFFADRIAQADADRTTSVLAPHPRLAELVLDRYDEALLASSRGWSPGRSPEKVIST